MTGIWNAIGAQADYSVNGATVASLVASGMQLLQTVPGVASGNSRNGGCLVQNQSISEAAVVFDDGAGGNVTIVMLDPAAAAGQQGGAYTADWGHQGRILIYGAAGAQIAVRVW